MIIKRIDYNNAIEQAYQRGLMKGRQEMKEECAREYKAATLSRRLECIEKTAATLDGVTQAAARIASAAENLVRWP